MKVLVIDGKKNANALDFCLRAQNDGHQVRWHVPDTEKLKHIGEGLVTLVREFESSLRWADLIFLADNTHGLRTCDQIRKINTHVAGPTHASAQWEMDRVEGMNVLEEHGIQVPEYREFNSFDDAVKYVKKEDRPFVSKPEGDADKSLSYVAKTPADLVYMLERWKKNSKLKPPFLLQEKIEGIEFAVGGWLGPQGFIKGWCENFEFKKLCNGDLGCATGEQGTVLRYVNRSKLADDVLLPLETTLLRTGHTGYVDVNCIIDENGQAWPLEFTMRPGWPTFNIQSALHEDTDCCEWLMDLTAGNDPRVFVANTVAIGVVLAIPDYPYSHITRKEVTGIPVYGTDLVMEHIHPCEMMLADAPSEDARKSVPTLCTAGDYVLVMTATGKDIVSAQRTVYDRLKKLIVPNSPMYRTDIGSRLAKQLPMLQASGYATNLHYRQTSKPSPEKPSEPSTKSSMMIGEGIKIIYV